MWTWSVGSPTVTPGVGSFRPEECGGWKVGPQGTEVATLGAAGVAGDGSSCGRDTWTPAARRGDPNLLRRSNSDPD